MTWMLVTTLCLQLSNVDADCRKRSWGPYFASKTCTGRMRDHEAALQALADDLGARVLFISVSCQRGRDG